MAGGSTRLCPTCGRTAWADATGCAYCKTDFRSLPPVGEPGEPVRRDVRGGLQPLRLSRGEGRTVVVVYAAVGLFVGSMMTGQGMALGLAAMGGLWIGGSCS